MKKRGLSILLALCMVLALLPVMSAPAQAAVIGDDYPYRGQSSGTDPWNFIKGNCTSFVAWRLNHANGVAFHNYYGGVHWGNASNWGYAAEQIGITVDSNPTVGSVAWISGGHVAWVAEVNGNNVTVEEYNWESDYRYHTITWPKSHYSGFIHINDFIPDSNIYPNSLYVYLIQVAPWRHLTANGGNVELASQNASIPKQIWHFVRQDDGSFKIFNEYNGYALDVTGAGTTSGTNVGVYWENGNNAQKWFVHQYDNGSIILTPYINTNLAMDVTGGGTNIQIYDRNFTAAQYFTPYLLSNDGDNYAKPSKPAASSVTTSEAVAGTPVTISWTNSALVNKWDARTYTLTVKDSSGNAVLSKADLTDTSCSFTFPEAGTYTAQVTAVNTMYYDYKTVGSAKTITVKPAAKIVQLDANGGTVSPEQISVIPGGTYGALPTPTRPGYQFIGWYTSSTNGDLVSEKSAVKENVDELYAHWERVYPEKGGNIYIRGSQVVRCDKTVTNVVVPDQVDGKNVSSIFAGVFSNAAYLRTLVLPTHLISIYRGNFLNCPALNAVYIPAYNNISLTTFWVGVDDDYSELNMDVYYGGTESDWNQIWYHTDDARSHSEPFNGTGDHITVHYNCDSPLNFAITQQPQDAETQNGAAAEFSVAVASGNGVTYQWQYLPTGTSEWINCTESGSDTDVLQIPASNERDGQRFRCVVTDAFETTLTSDAAALTVKSSEQTNPFTDVAEGKFYYDPILWAISQNPQVTTGVTDTSFMPDRICTRAHVVTFLWRANGCPEPANMTSSFKDVKETNKYYYKAVLWAAEQGITTGYSDGTFRPDDECTRGQVVTFLWRAKGQPTPSSASIPFTDVPAGKYYTTAVLWALQNNITKGRTATTFGPDDACTRGHVVTFLYRAYA